MYKTRLKTICLEQATNFLAKLDEEAPRGASSKPFKIVFILYALLVAEIGVKIYEWPTWYCFVDHYCQAAFISFDCLVMFLFYTVKETYARINCRMDAMANEKYVRAGSLSGKSAILKLTFRIDNDRMGK